MMLGLIGDHLPVGVPLLEVRERVDDLFKRKDPVNQYLEVALIYERSFAGRARCR